MKKKLIALLAAVAMVFSLAACGSTPDSVGTIGTVDITSGLYLLAQYDAYQKAADLASSEQDAADVKAFLKQTITVDADSGETATVSDYVADQTQKNLDLYAAVESRFDELGGQLTEAEESQADSYASQLMDQYADTYKANGIGLETLKRFERILLKSNDLLELVYGQNGETPVSDADLTSHLETSMYELAYYTVPLYNTSTYAFADDDQKAEMLSLAQAAVDSYNATAPDDAAAQHPVQFRNAGQDAALFLGRTDIGQTLCRQRGDALLPGRCRLAARKARFGCFRHHILVHRVPASAAGAASHPARACFPAVGANINGF